MYVGELGGRRGPRIPGEDRGVWRSGQQVQQDSSLGKSRQVWPVSASFGCLQVSSFACASFSKFRLLASLKFWVAKFRRVVSASSARLKFRQVSASFGKSRQNLDRQVSASFGARRDFCAAHSASRVLKFQQVSVACKSRVLRAQVSASFGCLQVSSFGSPSFGE